MILKLGGYDSRFEGFEDVHLAFKADQAQARCHRITAAKQIYRKRAEKETFTKIRVNGALAFYAWMQIHYPMIAKDELAAWTSKDILYRAVQGNYEMLRNLLLVGRYVRWRLS
ncbi:MAG: hypothetical protein J6386_13180 [Candidatus Synoicihabitans palmerolidicus]|nr:hypothetical protein [Candidatus Synoicihabitans palmerolidicus]